MDVEYFRFVRDIPFKIPVSAHQPLYTCVGKHVVLKTLLSALGLKVRYAFCSGTVHTGLSEDHGPYLT